MIPNKPKEPKKHTEFKCDKCNKILTKKIFR